MRREGEGVWTEEGTSCEWQEGAMRWSRDAGLHTLAAQSLGKLPAPDTLTHPNNTAGCCCTMTEPLPERPNTARYTPPARSQQGRGAGEEMTSNSCSLSPSLSPSLFPSLSLCWCVFVHLSYLFLSEKIPPTLPSSSHCDSTAPPMGGTRTLQLRVGGCEHVRITQTHGEGNIFWSQCVCVSFTAN